MTGQLSPYARRSGKNQTAGVGAANGSCGCNGQTEDANCYFQRIPIFQELPTLDPVPADGSDYEIEINHRGDWFEAKSMFLEARNTDGSVNHFAYVRAFEIDEQRQDCIDSDTPRGVPISAYSGQGGCCDGLRVCLDQFSNSKERKSLKIHVRVYGGAAGVVQGYLTGRCKDCGYEKLCQID